jgi:hypothetical protein
MLALVSASDYPAINIPNSTRYPTGLVAKQKIDYISNLFRYANAPNWVKPIERGKSRVDLTSVNERLINWRLYNRRRNGIYANVM